MIVGIAVGVGGLVLMGSSIGSTKQLERSLKQTENERNAAIDALEFVDLGDGPADYASDPSVWRCASLPGGACDHRVILFRGVWNGEPFPLLTAAPSAAQPSPESLARLPHAYALRDELNPAWEA